MATTSGIARSPETYPNLSSEISVRVCAATDLALYPRVMRNGLHQKVHRLPWKTNIPEDDDDERNEIIDNAFELF